MPTTRPVVPAVLLAGLAASMLPAPASATITFYDIFYSRILNQSIPDTPPATPPRFLFASRLITNDSLDLLFCTLSVPGRPARTLVEFNEGEYIFFSPTEYFSESSLVGDFPAGQYRHNISGGLLGAQSATLIRPGTLLWPSALPYFTGSTFSDFDAVNPAADFEVNVNPWTRPAGANTDVTFFVVYDNFTGAEVLVLSGPASTTTFTIPAGSLQPDTDYTVELIYSSRISNANAGFVTATGTVGFDYRTSASIRTTAAVTCFIDFNDDGFLNQEDLGGFLSAFLAEPPQPGPSGTNLAPCPGLDEPYATSGYAADFNRDCQFDQEDLGGYLTEYFAENENPVNCIPG